MEKSKQGRNWRVLLTEVGIIVLGVSIALGAEQAVDWFHWRNQVAQARQVIATEMANNVAGAVARLRTQACIDRRLDELAQILDDAARSGNLPPVGVIGIPPRRLWVRGAWDSLGESQTASHFPRQQLADLATIYGFVQRLDDYSPKEIEAWSNLSAMAGPGDRLDPASKAELRKALGAARTYSRLMGNMAFQMLARLKAVDVPYSQSDLDVIAAIRRESLTGGKLMPGMMTPMFQICQPIGAVPPHYGQGAISHTNILDTGLKLLPGTGGQ